MGETENVEQGASGEAIDYSRPVGWWCRNTQHDYALEEGGPPWCSGCIPRYLPIPEGQRPLVDDEVDEAEVVTWYSGPSPWTPFTGVMGNRRDDCGVRTRDIVVKGMDLGATIQRIVTGATE